MQKQLTYDQAYKAMFYYLKNLYELTKSEDLAGFLGSMSLLEDDIPADSAVLNDWNKAVEKALKDDDVSNTKPNNYSIAHFRAVRDSMVSTCLAKLHQA